MDEAGDYHFDHLPAGSYVVRQELPPGTEHTPETEREHVIFLGPADDVSEIWTAAIGIVPVRFTV